MRVELKERAFESPEWVVLSPLERWLYVFLLSEVSGDSKLVSLKKVREFTGFSPETFQLQLSSLVSCGLVFVDLYGAISLPKWKLHIEPQQQGEDPAILEVFEFWKKTFKKRSQLTQDREKKIKARLKTWAISDLKNAILGCASSPYHQGENERGISYNGIELIFRNDEKVEQFINYFSASQEIEAEIEVVESELDDRADFYEKIRQRNGG